MVCLCFASQIPERSYACWRARQVPRIGFLLVRRMERKDWGGSFPIGSFRAGAPGFGYRPEPGRLRTYGEVFETPRYPVRWWSARDRRLMDA